MKNRIGAGVSLVAFMLSILAACKNEAPKTIAATAAKAPSAGPKKVFEMRFSTPSAVVAGRPADLFFTPKIKGDEAAAVPLDLRNEQKLHLIAVAADLSRFEHLHPAFQADGRFLLQKTFASGGKYALFADYQPSGAGEQVEKIALEVGGKAPPPKTWPTAQTTATTADGYAVSLHPEIEKFVDKGETHIIVKILKNGHEIMASSLENYLGAKGHAIVVSADGELRYLHLHPGIESDRLHFAAAFGRVGTYRGWIEFQHAGKLQLADFVLQVVEGQGETPHEHDEVSH